MDQKGKFQDGEGGWERGKKGWIAWHQHVPGFCHLFSNTLCYFSLIGLTPAISLCKTQESTGHQEAYKM